jgi:hypothetical protein
MIQVEEADEGIDVLCLLCVFELRDDDGVGGRRTWPCLRGASRVFQALRAMETTPPR